MSDYKIMSRKPLAGNVKYALTPLGGYPLFVFCHNSCGHKHLRVSVTNLYDSTTEQLYSLPCIPLSVAIQVLSQADRAEPGSVKPNLDRAVLGVNSAFQVLGSSTLLAYLESCACMRYSVNTSVC